MDERQPAINLASRAVISLDLSIPKRSQYLLRSIFGGQYTSLFFFSFMGLSILQNYTSSGFLEEKDTLAGVKWIPQRSTCPWKYSQLNTSSAVAQPTSPPNSAPESTRTSVSCSLLISLTTEAPWCPGSLHHLNCHPLGTLNVPYLVVLNLACILASPDKL